jgi:hypothetical protein
VAASVAEAADEAVAVSGVFLTFFFFKT